MVGMRRGKEKGILLRPRSHSSQRVWVMGGRGDAGWQTHDPAVIALATLPDRHQSFASLKSVLYQLVPLASAEQNAQFRSLNEYISEVCPDELQEREATHGRLLAGSVAFSIMRRISRESYYTARIIDLAARAINDLLSSLPDCKEAHIDYVDRLDRPSLKVFARAMLLLKREHRFKWLWHSQSDPFDGEIETDKLDDLFVASRRSFLRQLVAILAPEIRRQGSVGGVENISSLPNASVYDISAALVLQNYDACFSSAEALLNSPERRERVEGLRLTAIAAVNIGRPDEAMRRLMVAERSCEQSGRCAHLCYLQGLIEAKRRYDLGESMAHYRRGLTVLEEVRSSETDDDLALERGWLLNGLALNEVIEWRRNSMAKEHLRQAFEFERKALELVPDGDSAARVYLRFNLLANLAFLMELGGNFDVAIDTFAKAFDFGLDEFQGRRSRWQSTLGYRIGVLHYRAGRLQEAYRRLSEAAEWDTAEESWPTQERILRALGLVALKRGSLVEACEIFSKGCSLCLEARAADGLREHASGWINALLMGGQRRRANEIYEQLVIEENVVLSSAEPLRSETSYISMPSSELSPKLPAYYPEVDLEAIPHLDLNRYFTDRRLTPNARTG